MFINAEQYERFMGRWSRQLAPIFLDFAGESFGGHVLDVGSGTGALASEIACRDASAHVVGVDPSPIFVDSSNATSPDVARVRYQVGDAQDLPFADGVFDHALSLLVFNFIPDPLKAVTEMRRVTKPGGKVAATVWDLGGEMLMLRTFWDAASIVDPKAAEFGGRNLSMARPGELAGVWGDAGLKNVCEAALDFSMHFASFADYWEPFLLGQGPAGYFTSTLSEDQVRLIRDEVKRKLSISDDEQPVHLPARAWAVRGTV